jgi:hypothetical protein
MENKIFDINIDANEVMRQYAAEQQAPQKKVTFDAKNYLEARLGRDEQSKTLTIRLLPFTPQSGTPFHKVFAHTVRVNKEVAASGWKTFVCPTHNTEGGDPLGDRCPFCETSSTARQKRFETTDELLKKKYNEIEFSNRAREMWIVRCIERGKENEGVKFWLFSHSKKKDGVYDKIMNIATQRAESAKKKGNNYSIFDLNNGMDLIITLTRTSDNKTNIQVLDEGMPSPLSTSAEEGMAWINDSKKWTDVYTVKNYDYMRIVALGGIPYYDKDKGCYIDKAELAAAREEAIQSRIAENLTQPTVDYSQVAAPQANPTTIIDGTKIGNVPQQPTSTQTVTVPFSQVVTSTVVNQPTYAETAASTNSYADDDDLPF